MSSAGSGPQVLIVGAGPTGLVLALCLRRLGARFRIVDKASGPGTTSRALIMHARTLEFYRQLGIADAIIAGAQRFSAANLWVGGKRRARLAMGDIGAGLSLFPYGLILPQDQHEIILVDALRNRGVKVEWETEVTDVAQRERHVEVTLLGGAGTGEIYEASYVAGCDGAHSIVREKCHIGLPGGTYTHPWYVADVEATGPLTNQEVNISMDDRDVIGVFPMKGEGRARLVGQAPLARPNEPPTWDSVNQRLLRELRMEVRKVYWFSTYRLHHRVAETFRIGRVFLLGDAAHLHSPVGGQGMNTGIGDAFNLGWKLAAVLCGDLSASVLDSYEPERIAFARGLVATTDRVFAILTGSGRLAQFFRTVVAPTIPPLVMRTRWGRRLAFRLLSQIAVKYRNSPLSRGRAGTVHGGDRLPWVPTPGDPGGLHDNFEPLESMSWQAHVYGQAAPPLGMFCNERRLRLSEFTWQPAMARAGLRENALYLVRPDGHVAFADPRADANKLNRYLAETLGITTF